MLFAAGCGGAAKSGGGAAAEDGSQDNGLPVIVIPECPSNASCPRGFEVNSQFWGMGVLPVRPESVGDEAIAVGGPGVFVEAMHPIEGVDPEIMAAVRCIPGECGEAEWVAAFGPADTHGSEALATAVATAICEHGIDPGEGDRCDRGGRISWIPNNTTDDERRFAYFSEYQDQVEQQLADGRGPSWRLDPVDTLSRHWIEEHGICIDEFSIGFYPRCRVAIGTPNIDGSTAAVAVTLQWAVPSDEPEALYYETYTQRFTLESTGAAWWVASFKEEPAIVNGTDDEGRTASDQVWEECCDMVLVDVEAGVVADL